MKKKIFIIILCIAVIGVFSGILFHAKLLDYLFKPMIMISIAGHFLIHSKNIDKNLVRLALFAFLFSLIGDSFLMFAERGMLYFILGLSSFL
ncbi:MAG TPA: lysoplasmalogenase family protein, partial [Draconibacterium sp.]|nr:lysoplasmalogenase family protein [Draconibacterium sp.]